MYATDYSQLVMMVTEPEEWPAFANYLEDINILKESFPIRDYLCNKDAKFKSRLTSIQC